MDKKVFVFAARRTSKVYCYFLSSSSSFLDFSFFLLHLYPSTCILQCVGKGGIEEKGSCSVLGSGRKNVFLWVLWRRVLVRVSGQMAWWHGDFLVRDGGIPITSVGQGHISSQGNMNTLKKGRLLQPIISLIGEMFIFSKGLPCMVWHWFLFIWNHIHLSFEFFQLNNLWPWLFTQPTFA